MTHRKREAGAGAPVDFDRRDVLQAAGALGLWLALPERSYAASEPAVRRRVTLGRTGVEVSDIGFGAYALEGDVRLIHHALERGITHFDTAEGYRRGRSEETLGRALADRRDDVTLTSKLSTTADERRESMMQRLEGSLRRLRTDRIDFHLNHAVDDVARLTSPEWQEFVARAKQQGKIRFSGMSGHGPNLASCLRHALEHDLADVLLVAYNYIQSPDWLDHARLALEQLVGGDWVSIQPELPELLALAQRKGVGVMVMKTRRGAARNDLTPYERPGASFEQAAFRWVLSDPRVGSMVVTMTSPEQIDDYLGASGATRPRAGDLALLTRYEAANRSTQCIQGCGACRDACPAGVPISAVLRARMYDADYRDPEMARDEYARLEPNASACGDCPAPCVSACPTGVAIPALTRDAHRRLAAAERR